MGNTKITKGNIDEVKAASNERIELTLLRKDFSKENFIRINLENAIISKCVFNETKFVINEFKNTDFTACDFTKAEFLNVKFIDCKFHECKFNEATLQEVNFENCTIMTSSFENIEIKDKVVGLTEKDMNIIHEDANSSLDEAEMLKIGFQKDEDQSFSISDSIDNGPKVELAVAKDEEYGENVYRIMFFVDDDCLLSDTFEETENQDYAELSILVKNILILGNKKVTLEFFEGDETKFDLYKKAYSEVKNKFKQTLSE